MNGSERMKVWRRWTWPGLANEWAAPSRGWGVTCPVCCTPETYLDSRPTWREAMDFAWQHIAEKHTPGELK